MRRYRERVRKPDVRTLPWLLCRTIRAPTARAVAPHLGLERLPSLVCSAERRVTAEHAQAHLQTHRSHVAGLDAQP